MLWQANFSSFICNKEFRYGISISIHRNGIETMDLSLNNPKNEEERKKKLSYNQTKYYNDLCV